MKAVMIAGMSSDSGKTTITLSLISALRKKGLKVQPFKVGPDYIDPGHHSAAASRPSHNLDGWMIPQQANVEIFHRASSTADIAVIEGVMGLFDGLDGRDQSGSSAEMAGMLRVPVILAVDASAMGRSAAAAVWGFSSFDPNLDLAGVIFNNVGGPSHEEILREALTSRCDIPCLGCLYREGSIHIDDRHLGLVTASEMKEAGHIFGRLAELALSRLDLDLLMNIAGQATIPAVSGKERLFKGENIGLKIPLAVAMDKAFNFYYQANLDLLEDAGAEIIPFSPLEETTIPAGVRGLYIGGGYPELFAAELADNRTMRESLRGKIAEGIPVFAECGGFMYLCDSLVAKDGREYPMLGIIPGRTVMTASLQALGYIEAAIANDSPLGAAGLVLRGHEYRWSKAELNRDVKPAYDVSSAPPRVSGTKSGFAERNIIAGYEHLHFASRPEAASKFLETMRKQKEEEH
ncbi:MAG: hypothetical protein A2W01_09990 [Candidatus Solincola sediminis]|uniref:Hydrogenobyrinate a,c-diamide synthase n=1 Tax=Candidatus Solincola sediminis TaxID=1797199 RepID=A0A1F2WQ75_9ACTN|nr:MAG: hypothetical protein A2Y75_00450 [Candidatus Solincola sediminis]OFW61494.1 MAG: hypothetical protein A2W01_09990 [Candidatus Solincola sediminis]